MTMRSGYPDNPMIDDEMKFKRGAIAALKEFKATRTFAHDVRREVEMRNLITKLAAIYEMPCPQVDFVSINGTSSGMSHYIPGAHKIVITGRMSIITLLHEFGHSRGFDEYKAVRFSVNLFKRVYPRQFERLTADGHFLSR